jgi:hypothetical protein
VLLLIGAYACEVLHAGKESFLVLVTASALVFVLIFRNLNAPPHGYQDLLGAVMIAAIAGPSGGWLFGSIADLIWRSLGLSGRRTKSAFQGERRGAKAQSP